MIDHVPHARRGGGSSAPKTAPRAARAVGLRAVLAVFVSLLAVSLSAHAANFKIGIILPTSDPSMGAIMTNVSRAIQLATAAAPSIDSVNTYTFVPIDSGFARNTAIDALFAAVDLGATAIIGEYASSISTPMALVGHRWKLWHCSGSSTSSDLSKKNLFPYFYRTMEDDPQQGKAMAYFVKSMGWSVVNSLAGSDSYGNSISQSFMSNAAAQGISVLSNQVFTPGTTTDFTLHLSAIAASGSNVIVFTGYPEDAVLIFRQAKAMGLIGPNWVWISPESMALYEASLPSTPGTTHEDVLNANGMFYTYPVASADNDRFRALRAAYSGLYGPTPDVAEVPYATTFYDCALATMYGIKRLVDQFGATNVLNRNYNATLNDFLTPFTGVSGEISYDGNGNRQGVFGVYNVYDGLTSLVYEIGANRSVTRVGTPKFFSGTSSVPPDRPPQTILYPRWSDAAVQVLAAIRGILILLFVVTLVYLATKRDQPIVKNLSFPFLTSITIGCILVLVSEFLVIDVPTRFSCHGGPWIFAIGFELVMASAAVKTYRVWKIFENRSLAKLKSISNHALFTKVGLVLLLQSVVFIIWIAAFPSSPQRFETILYVYYECVAGHATGYVAMSAISLVYNIFLLFVVCFFAYKTRNVMTGFKETVYVLYMAQNVFLSGILVLAFSYIRILDFALSAFFIRQLLVIYAVFFTFMAMVGRLAWALWRQSAAANLPPSASDASSFIKTLPVATSGRTAATAVAASSPVPGGIKRSASASPAGGEPGMSGGLSPGGVTSTHLAGRFPVKNTSKYLTTWKRTQVHLHAQEGYLVLVPDSADNKGKAGRVLKLGHLQFEPEPIAPNCIELLYPGASYLVQYESPEARAVWVNALTGVAKVSERRSTGGTSANAPVGTSSQLATMPGAAK
ncbi:hypothetical protein GGF32_009253 [Allomyces javanicus]|nr:hypothetical protein GGF32_009253 [Allomyces javanicus]